MLYMRALTALPMLCTLLLATEAWPQSGLQYFNPDQLGLDDSIPSDVGERIVMYFTSPRGGLEAHWVVVLVNLPYERVRQETRDLIEKTFGIESEQEIAVKFQPGKKVDPNTPKDPLYGDGFSDFYAIGVGISEGREYRIHSKQYNESWVNDYSKSEWRIIDGSRLFHKDCALIAVTRIDHSRVWAWGHPGIPLFFRRTVDTKLVTDKEIALIEKLLTSLAQPQPRYFLPNTGYKTDGVIKMMREIWEAAKALPSASATK